MQYGHFDDRAREYVITRPDTPAPWVNYLGSPEYGAIISNNAGGYSFARSGANGRILRYVFNQFDQPGRYLYLRDDDSGDFWSASWQPVGKDLAHYRSRCCHGVGYTRMLADYAGISSEATYYVPDGCAYEVWALRVTNTGPTPRRLTLTGYAEFTNHSNYEQDQVNLQYSLFISRTVFAGKRLTQQIHGNLDALAAGEDVDDKQVTERFFGLACAPSIFNERFSPYNHSGRHIFMPPAVRFSIGCGNSARQGLSGPAGGLPHPSCVGASGSDSMFHSTI